MPDSTPATSCTRYFVYSLRAGAPPPVERLLETGADVDAPAVARPAPHRFDADRVCAGGVQGGGAADAQRVGPELVGGASPTVRISAFQGTHGAAPCTCLHDVTDASQCNA